MSSLSFAMWSSRSAWVPATGFASNWFIPLSPSASHVRLDIACDRSVWCSALSTSVRSVACLSSRPFSGVGFEGASLEGGEDPQRVEVVAPRGDFAVLDDDNGDVSVAIRLPG